MRLRHKTTTAVITGTQWNEDHALAAAALGALGATHTVDLTSGSVQRGTLDANVTITLPAIPAGTTEHLTLILTNDATPGRSITITSGAGFDWITGVAPTLDDAASARNILFFRGTDGEGWIGDGGSA